MVGSYMYSTERIGNSREYIGLLNSAQFPILDEALKSWEVFRCSFHDKRRKSLLRPRYAEKTNLNEGSARSSFRLSA
jgi:hypothetical protein